MENKHCQGYVTEKIINAFYSGAIPIYWGSNDINTFFNPKSFINVSNFKNFQECVEYVVNISNEEIHQIQKEYIYQSNDLVYLINDNYNSQNENKILNKYIIKIKNFIEK